MVPPKVHIRNRIIISKATAALSMISSLLIMRDVDRKRRKGEIPLTFSLVFLMSCFEFFFSFFVSFMSSWMIPKETGVYLAAGNQRTCTAQGFLYVFFLTSTVLTNASLAITYCLKVRWTRINIYSYHKVIWALHSLPPFVGFCLALAALLDGAYNFSGGGLCEVVPYPRGCQSPDSDSECIRGLNAEKLKMALVGITIAANVVIIASIVLLVRSVFVQERKMDSYTFRANSSSRENTSKAAWQGIWYIAAFELAYGPWYLWQIIFISNHSMNATVELAAVPGYVLAVLFPTQGFWSLLVYFRPRYKSLRERHKADTRFSIVTRLLGISVPSLRTISSPIDEDNTNRDNHATKKAILHHDSEVGHFAHTSPELENSQSDGPETQLQTQISSETNDTVSTSLRLPRKSLPSRLMFFTLSLRGPAITLGEGNNSFRISQEVGNGREPSTNANVDTENSSHILENGTCRNNTNAAAPLDSITTFHPEQQVIVKV